jgi:hypothetical protein
VFDALFRLPQFRRTPPSVDAAWSAAAVALSCMRAHPLHGRSVLPLLPTILSLTDRSEHTPAAVSLDCGRLLQTRFGTAVSVAGAPAAASSAASAGNRGVKRQR